MLRDNWKVSLKAAAELAGVSQDVVLSEVKAGKFQICIKTPEDVVVFSDFDNVLKNEPNTFKHYSDVPRFGYFPEKLDNVSHLVLSLRDIQKLCAEGVLSVSKFSFAYVLQDGPDGVELKKISPPNLLYTLKLFSVGTVTNFPSKTSYGQPVSKSITIDDIYLVRGEVEKFKLENTSDYVRYGNFRVQPHTSKKLAALNEASTHFFSKGNEKKVLARDVESWLINTKLFSKTSAHLVAHFVIPYHSRSRGISSNESENRGLNYTENTSDFKFNDYTTTSLAIINEAAYLFSNKKLTGIEQDNWLTARGFGQNEVKEILKLINIKDIV